MADFDFALPALPERVWQALTDPARLATWFMDNDFQPVVGHRFTLRPQGLGGFDGPVYGEVLRIEPFRQIVMSWQYAGTRAMITWSVEAARGGTRLRVEQAGQLGAPAVQPVLAETSQRLYGERLRAVLGGVLLSQVEPAIGRPPVPAANPDADAHSDSGMDADNAAEADTDPAGAPPARRRGLRRQSLIWLAGCAALVIGLGTAGWRLTPAPDGHGDSSADPSDPTGVGVLGSAGAGRPGPTGSGPTRPTAGSSPSAGADASAEPGTEVSGAPQPTVDGEAPPSNPPVPGLIRLTFTQTGQLLGVTVQVTLTNPGPGAATWSNVGVRVPGVNLEAKSLTPSVTYAWKAPLACFTPTADFGKLPSGSTKTFSFTVSGVGTTVESALLDQAGCS